KSIRMLRAPRFSKTRWNSPLLRGKNSVAGILPEIRGRDALDTKWFAMHTLPTHPNHIIRIRRKFMDKLLRFLYPFEEKTVSRKDRDWLAGFLCCKTSVA
ncbi:hypothetical protein ACFL5Z_08600, partial [Planctomycetota bacterium]